MSTPSPALVNRLAGRVAAACAVARPMCACPGPWSPGCLCARPWRPSTAAPRAAAGRAPRLGLPAEAQVVAVSGGSLGVLALNRATLELAELWAARADAAIRHVVGRRDFDQFRAAAPALAGGGLVYQQVAYEEDMAACTRRRM